MVHVPSRPRSSEPSPLPQLPQGRQGVSVHVVTPFGMARSGSAGHPPSPFLQLGPGMAAGLLPLLAPQELTPDLQLVASPWLRPVYGSSVGNEGFFNPFQ
jgi:hypothetical protein